MFHHIFTPITHYYTMIYIKQVNVKDIFKHLLHERNNRLVR